MAVCILIPIFFLCFWTYLAVGEQLLKSQSADPFLNLEIDAGVSNVQRSRSWLSNIGPAHHEIDTASSHGPQMQDAFLSPLSNKGKCHFKSQLIFSSFTRMFLCCSTSEKELHSSFKICIFLRIIHQYLLERWIVSYQNKAKLALTILHHIYFR